MQTESNRQTGRGIGWTDLALAAATALLLAAFFTFARACDPHEDGGYMACHWANMSLIGLSAVLVLQSILHFLLPDARQKLGTSLAMAPVALLMIILPNRLIPLCMMRTMRCHSVMEPTAIAGGIALLVLIAIDGIRQIRRSRV